MVKSQVWLCARSDHKYTLTGLAEAGTYAIIFSAIEVNIAIICASLPVMKPLFVRFLPALVSEQPISVADNMRTCRALTGLHLLSEDTENDKEKARSGERRDTVVEMDASAPRITTTT
jgi:hypothetical protein